MDANWRTLWQRDRRGESGEAPVLAGATAVLPGDPARVVVTVEISYAMGLTCDDTDVYRLSDGQDGGLVSIGYKRPFATPRIEVAEVGGAPEPLDDQGLHVQA